MSQSAHEDERRIRTNRELTEIFWEETIIGAINSARMDEGRMPRKVFYRHFDGNRARGRPLKRWLDGVEEDAAKLGIGSWQSSAEDRQQWRQVVESAKTRLG